MIAPTQSDISRTLDSQRWHIDGRSHSISEKPLGVRASSSRTPTRQNRLPAISNVFDRDDVIVAHIAIFENYQR
jgi:hypothetical protein